MAEETTNDAKSGSTINSQINVPSLMQKKPNSGSKMTSNYIESESEFYTTTDDESDYIGDENKENSPTTPDTDNLEMILNDSTLESMTLKKRVKVYFLENGDWRDIGTGYVSGVKKFFEEEEEQTPNNNELNKPETEFLPYLLVLDEKSPQERIIMSQLEGEIEYQRQEETLIVWRDTLGKDIALSFEEISGCDHICDFIKYIQNNVVPTISLVAIKGDLNNMDVDMNNTSNVAELLAGPVALPIIKDDLSVSDLLKSLKIINDNLYQNFSKSSTQKFILDKDYLNCLVANFAVNVEKNDWQKIILISSILKSIMAYNEAYIIYRVLENDLFESCLAILEYDLDTPTMKANYIELYSCFKEQAHIKQELWFNDETLKKLDDNDTTDDSIEEEFSESENCKFLVGQLARLTFLKDFVFARYLDDYPIIQEVLQDDQIQLLEFITKKLNILDKLVEKIFNSGGDNEVLTENLKMLHECILMAKAALGNNTEESFEFMQKLVDIKIFEMLKFVFNIFPPNLKDIDSTQEGLKTITTDIALAIIENDIMALKDENGAISSFSSAFLADKREADIKTDDSIDADQSERNHAPVEIDLSLISVLCNLLTEDSCQYLKPQVLHALLALLNVEGSTGVEDFLTQSISKIEYKITEVVDEESDFCSEEEEGDDYVMCDDDSSSEVKLMGKSGALSMFMKQLNNNDDEEIYDDDDEEEEEELDEDFVVEEEDEIFYERELLAISQEPISRHNGLENGKSADEDLDYDMENSNDDNTHKKDGEKRDFDLDNFVAHLDHSEDDKDHYFDDFDLRNDLYDSSLEFPTTTRDRFLNYFYQHVAPTLLNSIINPGEDDFSTNNFIYLFDVVKFLIAEHVKVSKSFILTQNKQLLVNIAKIIQSPKSTFRIKIKSMKLLTAIVSLNDSDYIKFIVDENLLDSSFEIFNQYGQKNGIIRSIILEFLKLISDMSADKANSVSQQNFAVIGHYLFERYMETITNVTQNREYTVLKSFSAVINTEPHQRENPPLLKSAD